MLSSTRGGLLGETFIAQVRVKVGTYIGSPPGVKGVRKAQCQAHGCGSRFLEHPHIFGYIYLNLHHVTAKVHLHLGTGHYL